MIGSYPGGLTINVRFPDYLTMIKKKTAAMMEMCCNIGALIGGGTKKEINALSNFGKNIGIAFQIKDDLFDYTSENIGKPTGNDIKEKKLTFKII